MTQIKRLLGIVFIGGMIMIGNPAFAQTTNDNTTTTTTDSRTDDDDDDDDNGKWGLAGLVGLLGLLGLRKRDDDRHRTTSTTVNR